jgi:cell division septation protein DedD
MATQTESPFRHDDPAHEPRDGRSVRWFRWFVYAFVGLLALTVIVWALSGKPDRPAPVISGPSSPDREMPAEDSSRVPYQDQPIYERLAAGSDPGRGKELLPAAEVPMSRQQLATAIGVPESPPQRPPAASADSTLPDQLAAVRPPLTDSAPLSPVAPPPNASAGTPDQVSATRPAPPSSLAKEGDAMPDGFRIQIASVRTRDQAAAEWARVSGRNPDLLSRLDPYYAQHSAGDRGDFVRVQGGPLVDKTLAEMLCSQLKARKVDCLVITP